MRNHPDPRPPANPDVPKAAPYEGLTAEQDEQSPPPPRR